MFASALLLWFCQALLTAGRRAAGIREQYCALYCVMLIYLLFSETFLYQIPRLFWRVGAKA